MSENTTTKTGIILYLLPGFAMALIPFYFLYNLFGWWGVAAPFIAVGVAALGLWVTLRGVDENGEEIGQYDK